MSRFATTFEARPMAQRLVGKRKRPNLIAGPPCTRRPRRRALCVGRGEPPLHRRCLHRASVARRPTRATCRKQTRRAKPSPMRVPTLTRARHSIRLSAPSPRWELRKKRSSRLSTASAPLLSWQARRQSGQPHDQHARTPRDLLRAARHAVRLSQTHRWCAWRSTGPTPARVPTRTLGREGGPQQPWTGRLRTRTRAGKTSACLCRPGQQVQEAPRAQHRVRVTASTAD